MSINEKEQIQKTKESNENNASNTNVFSVENFPNESTPALIKTAADVVKPENSAIMLESDANTKS